MRFSASPGLSHQPDAGDSTCLVEAPLIRVLISLAASAERWARPAPPEATTAKPLTGLAGPGRLDAGVQGQQVGLEGDFVDHADDVADLARAGLDLAHGRDGLV